MIPTRRHRGIFHRAEIVRAVASTSHFHVGKQGRPMILASSTCPSRGWMLTGQHDDIVEKKAHDQ